MISVFAGSLLITIGVLLAEYLGKKNILSEESSRKIPHVVNSIAVSIVALFVDVETLKILILLYTIVAILIIRFNLFAVARAVDRLSWGELFFPAGLVVSAFIAPDNWVFIASALVLGLSDAAAALVGRKYGIHRYKVADHYKTLEGSLAFFLTTLAILVLIANLTPANFPTNLMTLGIYSLCATIVEGAMPWGMDNMFLPIVISLMSLLS